MFYSVVKNFMQASGQTICVPNEEQARLYLKLCIEEYEEFLQAETDIDKLDACCDLAWVAIGCLISSSMYEDEFNDKIGDVLMDLYINGKPHTHILDLTADDFEHESVFTFRFHNSMIKIIIAAMGTAFAHHWLFLPAFYEVARSNMAKVDRATGKVIKREDGKIMKPDGWTPPNLEAFV